MPFRLDHGPEADTLRALARELAGLSCQSALGSASGEQQLAALAKIEHQLAKVTGEITDSIRRVATLIAARPITQMRLGGRTSIPVACVCGWDDDGTLEIADTRHPEWGGQRALPSEPPLVLLSDGRTWCPGCGGDLTVRTVVPRTALEEAVVA